MSLPEEKGNDPEKWNKILAALDEKLQLSLLYHLRNIKSYHFEDDILYLEPSDSEAQKHLSQDRVSQHLEILVKEVVNIRKIKLIKKT